MDKKMWGVMLVFGLISSAFFVWAKRVGAASNYRFVAATVCYNSRWCDSGTGFCDANYRVRYRVENKSLQTKIMSVSVYDIPWGEDARWIFDDRFSVAGRSFTDRNVTKQGYFDRGVYLCLYDPGSSPDSFNNCIDTRAIWNGQISPCR